MRLVLFLLHLEQVRVLNLRTTGCARTGVVVEVQALMETRSRSRFCSVLDHDMPTLQAYHGSSPTCLQCDRSHIYCRFSHPVLQSFPH